jgi:hypothetical protein
MATLPCVRNPGWWDTGDPGNRLAALLCAACPARARCEAAEERSYGVVRAGTIWTDAGHPAPLCGCGRPILGRARHCTTCDPPWPRRWDQQTVWRQQKRRQRARTEAVAA